jgi:hypothetical protein
VLICFGCGEVRVYGPESALLCDMPRETADKLQATLKRYRKNRPEREQP